MAVRVPLVACWPGTIKPGTTCDVPYYFPDFMATACELVRSDVPRVTDGLSLLPALRGEKPLTHAAMYWEFPGYGGQQAVREGNWKAVRQALGKGVVKTELYDLSKDEGEATDVAAANPAVVARLESLMKQHHTLNQTFPLQTIDPPAKK